MKLVTAVLLLLLSTDGFADTGLDQLRKSFAPQMLTATKEFDRAEAMKAIHVPMGKEITQEECKALEDKIKVNYKIDPFHLRSEGNNNNHYACGGSWRKKGNFLSAAKGFSNFHRAYVSVLQSAGTDYYGTSREVSNYYLDENNAIVEIQTLYFDPKSFALQMLSIQSLDEAGNLYFLNSGEINNTMAGIKGLNLVTHIILADGSQRMIRSRVRAEGAKHDQYIRTSFERADKADWESMQMMITYRGPYYIYGGKPYDIYSKPAFKSELSVEIRDGKERCASGAVRSGADFTTYPENSQEYWACQRY